MLPQKYLLFCVLAQSWSHPWLKYIKSNEDCFLQFLWRYSKFQPPKRHVTTFFYPHVEPYMYKREVSFVPLWQQRAFSWSVMVVQRQITSTLKQNTFSSLPKSWVLKNRCGGMWRIIREQDSHQFNVAVSQE